MEYSNNEEQKWEEKNESSDAVYATPKKPVYSWILIACIIAVSIAQFVTGLEKSLDIAGFVKPAFLQKYEYWRILTGGALHIGIVHLAFNSFALLSFGRSIEVLSNRAHLAIVFLLAVVGGGLLSLIFSPDGSSAGASGGIIGFLGYLLIYAYKRRKLLPPEFAKNLLTTIGLNAIIGISLYQFVDNFAHLGGLLAGAAYGLLQIPNNLEKDPRVVTETTEVTGIVALGFFVLISIFSILLILGVISFYG
jgi:membrane associated rhomboid family serine protease